MRPFPIWGNFHGEARQDVKKFVILLNVGPVLKILSLTNISRY